ncbi:MAG: CBS domain-containing protein [Nitrospirota bacterium]
MLKIRDVLQSKSSAIWSIRSKDTAYEAMEFMAERNIGVLLVIDDESVAGIVSERDFVRSIVLQEKSAKEVLVENLMTREIYCVTPDKPVEECMGVMTTAHCRHMPVFENGRLIGIVTFGDIVNALLVEQKIKIQDLESYASCCDSVSFDD